MIPLIIVKFIDLESMLVVARGWEKEGIENDYGRVQGFFMG